MPGEDRDLQELGALVEENRKAFLRAKRLLSAMKNRSPCDHETVSPDSADDSPQVAGANGRAPSALTRWVDLNQLATVELSSKDDPHQLKATALAKNPGRTWHPKEPGAQTILLQFDAPQSITKVRVVFIEEELERTQEFVLRWRAQGAKEFHEIVRQQYVFSPSGSMCEVEEYSVDLKNLVSIELSIVPNISGSPARASLSHWALGTEEQTDEPPRA